MVKLTDDAITTLHDKIQTNANAYETLNLAVTDKSNIVGTIVVDSNVFNVTAKVVGSHAGGGGGPIQLPAQIFTVLCGITSGGGTSIGNYWQYTVPHPFNGLEYSITVIDATTKQEQHVDIVKQTDYAIINLAQQTTQCYDVTFIGYVA